MQKLTKGSVIKRLADNVEITIYDVYDASNDKYYAYVTSQGVEHTDVITVTDSEYSVVSLVEVKQEKKDLMELLHDVNKPISPTIANIINDSKLDSKDNKLDNKPESSVKPTGRDKQFIDERTRRERELLSQVRQQNQQTTGEVQTFKQQMTTSLLKILELQTKTVLNLVDLLNKL